MQTPALEGVKVGDLLAVEGRRLIRVTRLTTTQAICYEHRFNLRTGYLVGPDSMHVTAATIATRDQIAAINLRACRNRVAAMIEQKIDRLSADQLDRIAAILKEEN